MRVSILFLAVFLAACGSAHALPILLGTISHDYGIGSGKVDPGGNDAMSPDYVSVSDKSSSRFSDDFDLSGLDDASIDHFILTLTFSNTNDSILLGLIKEAWNARPGETQNLFALTRTGSTAVSQSFTFTAANLSTFQSMVDQGVFHLWFAEESLVNGVFKLYDAELTVFGEPAPAPVPEPASLVLTGCGLAGLAMLRRRRAA